MRWIVLVFLPYRNYRRRSVLAPTRNALRSGRDPWKDCWCQPDRGAYILEGIISGLPTFPGQIRGQLHYCQPSWDLLRGLCRAVSGGCGFGHQGPTWGNRAPWFRLDGNIAESIAKRSRILIFKIPAVWIIADDYISLSVSLLINGAQGFLRALPQPESALSWLGRIAHSVYLLRILFPLFPPRHAGIPVAL